MWSGTISAIPSDWQLCDGTNGSPDLRNSFVKCVGASEDPGATGGAASQSYTPAGTCSAPTFTGSALATHTHGVGTYANGTASFTPAGTVASPTFTGSSGTVPAETISWPASVPTFAGSAMATHTHTGGTLAGATNSTAVKLYTANTSTGSTVATLSGATGATSAGTPAGTVAWPASVPTNATAYFTPAGTNSAPAFTGTAGTVPAETLSGSSSAVSAGTPAGTVTAPAFTGTGATIPTEPAYFKLAFITRSH